MVQKLKVVFAKFGDMKFISHLDVMRLFQRASRRAAMPVTVTKGFSPHLKISIPKALKLGFESQGEEAVFYMDEKVDGQDFIRAINDNLPQGIRVMRAEGLES